MLLSSREYLFFNVYKVIWAYLNFYVFWYILFAIDSFNNSYYFLSVVLFIVEKYSFFLSFNDSYYNILSWDSLAFFWIYAWFSCRLKLKLAFSIIFFCRKCYLRLYRSTFIASTRELKRLFFFYETLHLYLILFC